MQPWFTVDFSKNGHPCYDQLTPVKTVKKVSADPYHVTRAQVYSSSRSRYFEVVRWSSADFLLDRGLVWV